MREWVRRGGEGRGTGGWSLSSSACRGRPSSRLPAGEARPGQAGLDRAEGQVRAWPERAIDGLLHCSAHAPTDPDDTQVATYLYGRLYWRLCRAVWVCCVVTTKASVALFFEVTSLPLSEIRSLIYVVVRCACLG